MRKKWTWLIGIIFMVLVFLPVAALPEEEYNPPNNLTGTIGKTGRSWRQGGFGRFQMPEITAPTGNPPANYGWLYVKDLAGASALYFENDAGVVVNLAGGSATAYDDIAAPDANKTLAFTTFTSLWTGTSTAADQWVFSGRGNFGDVSVVRIEQSTGNPTDGTVLEVVSADTDCDALLVTANSVNVLKVNGAGTLTITGVTGITGDTTVTGNLAVTGTMYMSAVAPSVATTTLLLDGKTTGGVNIGSLSTGGITLSRSTTLADGTDLLVGEGTVTIDNDQINETALTITSDATTTGGAISITSAATTGGTAISITANDLTTGDAIYIASSAAGMTTGNFVNFYNGAATVFKVGLYGATTIAGNASTDILTITAGDIQVTAGDIDLDLGIITIDNTADEGNTIKRNNATGTAAVLEIEQTHATGGKALLLDQKSTTVGHYALDITSSGATQIHFTANGAAGSGMLYDATDAWTGQAFVIDAGPWLGTLNRGVIDFRSDSAATAEVGSVVYIKMQGTAADAAAIDGKGLYIEDEAGATAGSYLVKLDTKSNTALHIFNSGAAADGIKIDVADSYTGQGFVADLGPWLGTAGEGFISLISDNAATVPAGQFMRFRQLGTGQHAAAIAGSLIYLEDDATAPAAGTSYVLYIDATNIEAIHVDTGKVLVDETVTATGGLSSGTAADSLIFTDTVTLSNADIKALRAAPKALVAAPGANKFIELVSAVLIMNYGSEALTVNAGDDLVIQYHTSGQDITGSIETNGFLTAAADTMAFVQPAGIATVPAANVSNKAIELFNTGGAEIAGNASLDTTMIVKVSYRIHADGL